MSYHRPSFLKLVVPGIILLITLTTLGYLAGLSPWTATAASGNLVVNPGFDFDGAALPALLELHGTRSH